VQGIGSNSNKTPVLVYGASSATGTLALQLLRSSGYEVLAVCSPRNFRLVQSRGATKCFDYHSSACAAQIKQYTKKRLALVLDCITSASSMRLAYDAMALLVENTSRWIHSRREYSVHVRHQSRLLLCADGFWLAHRTGWRICTACKVGRSQAVVKFMKTAETLIAQGQLEPHPAALQQGGLAGIIDAIDMLRKGKVSGQKLVFRVA